MALKTAMNFFSDASYDTESVMSSDEELFCKENAFYWNSLSRKKRTVEEKTSLFGVSSESLHSVNTRSSSTQMNTKKRLQVKESKLKSFSENRTLIVGVHKQQNPYSCDTGSQHFHHKKSLDKPKRFHKVGLVHACNLNSKSFSQEERLARHTDEKHYLFTSHKKVINIHKRVYTGEKPYVCDACSKCFSRKTQLRGHMRIHTGEKPYTCDICSKSFSQRAHLYEHKRVHTGEKPYSCGACSKCFSSRHSLDIHERGHTGEKPYT